MPELDARTQQPEVLSTWTLWLRVVSLVCSGIYVVCRRHVVVKKAAIPEQINETKPGDN